MKNLETEKAVVNEPLSEVESVNLTEWLIFKIKIIYGRPIFEGDSPEEASAIRHEWQDLVLKIGKNGVLATIDFLLSGHHAVPSFPPSSVEFRKCYRTYTSPSVMKETYQEKEALLTKEQRQIGCQKIGELLSTLKIGYLKGVKK